MATETKDISPEQLREWMDAGGVTLIDVRDPEEHYARRIEGATLKPLGNLGPDDVPAGRVVVHCLSGMRGGEAAARMARSGRDDVYNLAGGIKAWRRAGYDVTGDRLIAISLWRQVQILAGSIVFAGVILGVTVSEWFLIASGFVGAGFIFAGATGFCGMGKMLGLMPWNRAPSIKPSAAVGAAS